MDTWSVQRGLDFTRRNKKWVILLGLVGSSYGAYKVYHVPSVARKREKMLKFFGALVSIAEMISDSAETITVVSRDLKEFLKSDSDEIPNSLKQLSKIARSEEFSETVIRVCHAVTIGILRGYKVENIKGEIQEVDGSSIPEKVMDKLMSDAGRGFVSVIVGSFARNLVMGFYGSGGSGEGLRENGHLGASSSSSTLPTWVTVVSDDKCRVLIADGVKTFVSTAVAVYLDKTMDVNFYDEIFSGLTNPKHGDKVADILVSICNGAVETLVKTFHQVLTAPKQGPKLGSSDSFSVIDQSGVSGLVNKKDFEPKEKEMNGYIDLQNSGWINRASSTLAVPRNRKFVVDVTGRVTFETVRSLVQFLLWKICEGLKTSLNVVHDEVLERGFEVIRYVGAKSSVILTICLALFLHILGNTRVLLPA